MITHICLDWFPLLLSKKKTKLFIIAFSNHLLILISAYIGNTF